nr:uncharacterized protein LOC110381140 isoform X1 [Helicoverpa armigera]
MKQSSIIILTVLIVQAYSAPQFITFSEGKLGVNFGGYHAGVGLGGLAGGNGRTGGGLYAEAGTPNGPAARAGLGGAVDGNSGTFGGLFAGATAGGNVNAAAGLGGAVSGGKSVGGGYSTANAGGHGSSSVLGGETDVSGASGFSVSAHKSVGVPLTVVKETEVSVVPVEEVKSVHKKVYGEAKFESANEITPVANAGVEATAHVNVNADVKPVIVKEVSKWKGPHYRTHKIPQVYFPDIMRAFFRIPQRSYVQPMWLRPQTYYAHQVHVEPTPTEVITIRKHKPHRHHLHKTVFIGGYAGAGGEVAAPETKVKETVVYKTVQPIQKRIDIEAHGDAGASVHGEHGHGQDVSYRKEVVVSAQKPSTFFQDIFNIPISTLKAVSGFLTNTAENTGVTVHKSASVQAGGHADVSGGAGFYGHSGYSSYY